ncbi:MAG: hypothetical protein VXV76_04220 [Candidatus Thermoplasmatota archaeon]|nr:hypothetical protein [Candidatus Thermoplasmatota archaeon]MEC8257996.1 hypothetical protein [Candidatus Thermoplasmatota archaeon]MEC8353185.1 hypothetical protein [Candidatus Thermoplasmatota archaeon]
MDDKDWYSKQGIRFQYQPGQPHASINSVEDGNNAAEKPHWLELEDNSSKHLEKPSEEISFPSKTITGIILIGVTIVLQILLLLSSNFGEEEIDEDMTIEEMVEDVEDTADFLFALNLIFLLLQLVGLILIGLDVTELSYFLRYRVL